MSGFTTGTRTFEAQSFALNDILQGPLSFRNKIINGNFDFWQRGSATANLNGVYLADRWRTDTNTTGTVSQQAFTVGQTEVPGEPVYFLRFEKTGTGDFFKLSQRIEDVRTLANKSITVSFYAKASIQMDLKVTWRKNFGSGAPAELSYISEPVNLTTSWKKYVMTFPNIGGAGNFGSVGADSFLALQFFPGNENPNVVGIFDLAQVQLEEGTVATPFEQRPIGLELELCQRYYEDLEFTLVRFSTGNFGGAYSIYPFKTVKRSTNPTPTLYSSPFGTLNHVIKNGTILTAVTDTTITRVANNKQIAIWNGNGTVLTALTDYCTGFITIESEL